MPRGRFAPSPSGPLHIGNLRTALLAWLHARHAGDDFVVRIEDLDPATSRDDHARSQLGDLARLGLDWDGEPLRQSTRRRDHLAAIAELTDRGLTYPCWCSRREILEAPRAPHEPAGAYPGTCRRLSPREAAERAARDRPPALRLRADLVVADREITFTDGLHGPVTHRVDDLVVRRGDGTPSYHVAVVLDDHHQGVEEVVRGDDLLASTVRHLVLARAWGLPEPRHVHVPLVLAPDGSRLAKRHGAVTLADRLALGDTPARVVGRLAASVGLARTGEDLTPDRLLDRFEPGLVPTTPWRLHPRDLEEPW